MKNNILGGTEKPTESNRYQARDGLYYNSYCLSTDCAEDAFGECMRKMSADLEKEILEMYMKSCCVNSPRILKDKKWVCSECDSIILDDEQLSLFGYFGKPIEEVVKCDCGAEALHGQFTPGHYPMCSKLKHPSKT